MDITNDDINNIKQAINDGGDIWESLLVKDFKKRLKGYFRSQKDECCYCKKNFFGEFNMVIDIEHILPKSKFQDHMFSLFNLSIACKRCNMNVKRESIKFIHDVKLIEANPKDKNHYKLIHPNLDNYDLHLKYFFKVENEYKILKYQIVANSEKGKFSYDFFKLKELEIDTFNQAQGIKQKNELSDDINETIIDRLENVFKNL